MRRFRCSECGRTYSIEEKRYRCKCGGAFDLEKSISSFPTAELNQRENSLWRYREVIPVRGDENIVSFGEGITPLVPFKYAGLNLLGKLEYLMPTGSFKDRGASVLVSFLKEIGVDSFIEDSSGNAGAAMSAYAARADISCQIFCPDYASGGKLNQIQLYGGKLNKIKGTRANTQAAVQEAAETSYYASHNWNPFFVEGLKTIAFEIAEQLDWKPPKNVVCPLGYGGLLLGLYTGFKELKELGLTNHMPGLFGVQSEACCPIYHAFKEGKTEVELFEQKATTLAEGICAIFPMRGNSILQALTESGGSVTVVSEEEIKLGIRTLAGKGFFVEPTSAVVLKALDHFVEYAMIDPKEQTVVIFTGHGLKAVSEISSVFKF